MATIRTNIVPEIINHTLNISETERLAILSALRYRIIDAGDVAAYIKLSEKLVDTLLKGGQHG